jgi:hypothetical protein
MLVDLSKWENFLIKVIPQKQTIVGNSKTQHKIASSYYYFGNCSNTFNPSDGKSLDSHFVDVSDFALKDENAIEIEEKYFSLFVNNIPQDVQKNINGHEIKYLFYNGNIFVIYDINDDMHYFFGK